MDKDWNMITLKEAAKIIGLKPRTISGWIADEKLPFSYYKISSRCIRFKKTEVLEYLEKIRNN